MQQTGSEGVFSLAAGDSAEQARWLVEDARVPLISFTGSSRVGREVARTVAGRMGRCLLECSGNNAVIVDEHANLALALPAIVFGAVGTAGQRCTTTRRLIVHEARAEDLEAQLQNAYAQVRVGDPLERGTLMGPLIDRAASEQFRATMSELQQRDYLKQYEVKLISPEEAATWKRGASNAGYHYLGCAKTFALMGKAFAEALLAIKR